MIIRLLLCAYLVALGWVVFAPASDASQVTGIVATLARFVADGGLLSFAHAYAVLEFLANVVLFVPFGVLWPFAVPRLRPIAVISLGLATSAGIELVQLLLPSRVPAVSDVIANTLGTALGVGVAALVTAHRGARTTRRPGNSTAPT
ncbi:VanZ family protein [Microbacterium sp.]|uniref:VanZ family protein n=1 Tax=Microbacterium sp. TaxID=51671 RepID=UPI002CF481C0|nr:VanZ family protein [Microbacterium sp.]HWL76958.1 VanZ family protein [Microbacterium sp.]